MSTWTDVRNYILTQLRPGVLGNTNVQKILNSVLAIINQINAGDFTPTPDAQWKPDVTYAADVEPVLWQDRWLVSNIANNLGNVPISTAGVVHPTWRVIAASVGSGIRIWEPIVYPNTLEVVFASGGLYYLNRASVGSDPFVSTNFTTELAAGQWVFLTGEGGGTILPDNILAALAGTLGTPSGTNRYVTADNLAVVLASIDVPTGARVILSNVSISSPTAGTITATWVDNQGDTNTVTAAALTFSGAPAAGNFRFDNVLGNDDGTVSVQTGTPATSNPIIPTAPAGSLILSTVLWNDAGQGQVVPPAIVNAWSVLRYGTQIGAGTQGLFAKIWDGPLSANDHFAFQLLYHGPREVTNFQGDGAGKVKVSFTCNPDLTIQAGTVQIETESNAAMGDFRLIRTSGNRAALYHRSRIFWGRIQYRIAYHSSAVALSDFSGGSYAAAPTAAQTFDSVPVEFDDFVPSTGAILFDVPRKYGYNGTPVSGNITLGITGAKEKNMAKMLHAAATQPTITPPGGVTLHLSGGTYNTTKVNEYLFICHKNDAGVVTRISYSISPNQL